MSNRLRVAPVSRLFWRTVNMFFLFSLMSKPQFFNGSGHIFYFSMMKRMWLVFSNVIFAVIITSAKIISR